MITAKPKVVRSATDPPTEPVVNSLTIMHSTFSSNLAIAGSIGGYQRGSYRVHGDHTESEVSSSLFTGNRAVVGPGAESTPAGAGLGGAIEDTYSSPGRSQTPASSVTGPSAAPRDRIGQTSAEWLGRCDREPGERLPLNVSNSQFLANLATGGAASNGVTAGSGEGGAIDCYSSSLNVANSQLLDNVASGGAASDGATAGYGGGGAIGNDFGILDVSSSLVSGNIALGGSGGGNGSGGGVYSYGSTATITDTLITLNIALGGSGGGNGSGGGVYISEFSTATITATR